MTNKRLKPSAWLDFRSGWPTLMAATLGSAFGLSSLPFYTLGSFIAPLQAEFGWGRGGIASSYVYTTVVLALSAPLLGMLADRIGVRPVALISIPLFAATMFLMSRFKGTLDGFHALFALAALIGGGATPVTYTRAVVAAFPRARGLALGISLAGIGAAASLLPVLLAAINARHGWRSGYLVLAILALLPWPFVLFGLPARSPETPSQRRRIAGGALRTGLFWTLAFIFVTVAVAVSALIVHMPPLLHDAGLSPLTAARVTALIGVGILVGRLGVGYLLDRFFAPYVAATTLGTAACGCVLLAMLGVEAAPATAFTTGLALGTEVDVMAYLTIGYFGLTRYAFLYGILYSLFTLGGALGPTLAGIGFDSTGSYTATLWSIILLLIVAASVLLALPRFTEPLMPEDVTSGCVGRDT